MPLLLDVWREACRHIEITESADRIAVLAAEGIPLDFLLVRRLDDDRQRLETVAAGALDGAPPPLRARTELHLPELEAVREWSRRGEVLRGRADAGGLLGLLLPPGTPGEAILGPLSHDGRPAGVVAFVARGGGRLRAEHEDAVRALLEPLSVALANDVRMRELGRLKEALEADRQALLSRLERQDVSDAIVGVDAGLRDVMARLDRVARTDAPVLILGETGTGKEVLARAIHARSRRAQGPMVRVNCGAIPPGLVDSELFGHERGSFTGAVGTRKGWFERADGGTLFLDEIGELPGEAQVRLLRILQDGTFERVGGARALSVDVRIVAATHRDLQAMVREGGFREDLWYRLGVFPITLPPLRERLGDVPALAAHFAWRAGKRLGGTPLAPAPDDLELLVSYPWPGNVRELASVIERAAILGDGHRLEVAAALGVSPRRERPSPRSEPDPPPPPGAAPPAETGAGAFPTLDEAQRLHIERALEATGGRVEGARGAAALLGINPHTLRARMRKLGVEWSRFRRAEEREEFDGKLLAQ